MIIKRPGDDFDLLQRGKKLTESVLSRRDSAAEYSPCWANLNVDNSSSCVLNGVWQGCFEITLYLDLTVSCK